MVARKKNGRQSMSVRDLAEVTGVSRTTISELSMKKTWKGVKVELVEAFANACGVDLFKPADTYYYLKNSKQTHLKNMPASRRRMFAKMFKQD